MIENKLLSLKLTELEQSLCNITNCSIIQVNKLKVGLFNKDQERPYIIPTDISKEDIFDFYDSYMIASPEEIKKHKLYVKLNWIEPIKYVAAMLFIKDNKNLENFLIFDVHNFHPAKQNKNFETAENCYNVCINYLSQFLGKTLIIKYNNNSSSSSTINVYNSKGIIIPSNIKFNSNFNELHIKKSNEFIKNNCYNFNFNFNIINFCECETSGLTYDLGKLIKEQSQSI